jgi:hypothetical protein
MLRGDHYIDAKDFSTDINHSNGELIFVNGGRNHPGANIEQPIGVFLQWVAIWARQSRSVSRRVRTGTSAINSSQTTVMADFSPTTAALDASRRTRVSEE